MSYIDDVVQQVLISALSFLKNNVKNSYIQDNNCICEVYVRKGVHIIHQDILDTFDIANISVHPDYRGQRIGSTVIQQLHKCHKFDATYVESILNERLYTHLKSDQWQHVYPSNPPCLYKYTC